MDKAEWVRCILDWLNMVIYVDYYSTICIPYYSILFPITIPQYHINFGDLWVYRCREIVSQAKHKKNIKKSTLKYPAPLKEL